MAVQKWHLEGGDTVVVHRAGNVWRSGLEVGSVRIGHVQKMHPREDEEQWNAMTADGRSTFTANRVDGVRWLIEQAGLQVQS